jgi:hypothetical protein
VSAPPARLLFVLLAFAGAAAPPANVVVTPPGGQVHGGRLARDPRHPARLVAVYWDERRERRGTCTIARSSDGGATWTSAAFAGTGSGNPLPSGTTLCRNPVAAFGPEGALYVAYEAARLEGFAQVELTRSTDDGASFGPARLLDPDASGGGDRDPSIAAGTRPGRVYVAFQRYSADEERAEVAVVTSADGGVTASAPVRVSPPAQNAAGSRASLAVDGAGRVYAAWVDGARVDLDEGAGTATIEVASSPAGGQSFGAAGMVAEVPSGCGPNDDCGNHYPDVTVAATGVGRVVAAWSSAAFPDPARLSSARSADGGRSWTAPKAVAQAAVADRDQHAPDLSTAPDGRLDLAYLEQARDADNGLLDAYLVHSLDGGKTFSRPLLLDDTPSITDRDSFDAAVSVSSSNASALATWIDGRRGNAGAATSDVVFAVRRDSDAPAAPVIRGALLVRAGRTATYRLSSRDGFTPAAALRFRCALDGAPLHLCSARFVPQLTPGRHVLRAQAVDAAGNRSALTRTVVVATAPAR